MSSGRKTVLYFAPHQDDELLSMGVDICSEILKKHEVHVILCSDGSKSSVRQALCNGKACRKHEGTHDFELSSEEFIQARDREFIDSCIALGVKKENIHIPEEREQDGSITVKNAESIIRRMVSQTGGNAVVCTLSPTNGASQHADHKALGTAVNNLLNRGTVREARFFIEPYLFNKIADNPRLIPVDPTVKKASSRVKTMIEAAAASYSLWNPAQQRYAVGYHSVTTEFSDFLDNTNSYYYLKKSEKSMVWTDRLAFNHRKWAKLKKQKQLFYSLSGCDCPDLGSLELVSFGLDETEKYREFCEKYGVEFKEREAQRLNDGSSYWCLVNEDKCVVSGGWLAYRQKFYISETDYGFDMSQSSSGILYNFNTREEHRGKGYYGMLLREIISHAEGPDNFIIYTSPDNIASARGITKAGFFFDGELSASDNSLKKYLKNAGFVSISRKYRLWGLLIDR